jgi:hypothetical protein
MAECVGVLVIRAWCEMGTDASFRARVLAVGTSLEEVELVTVASSASEVVDVVRDWLGAPGPRWSESAERAAMRAPRLDN